MNIIEKIEKGVINLEEFNEEQIVFIKGLIKMSFNEGYDECKLTLKSKINAIIEEEYIPLKPYFRK